MSFKQNAWKKETEIIFLQIHLILNLPRLTKLMYAVPHLDEGHPRALDGHNTHRLAELQVQD